MPRRPQATTVAVSCSLNALCSTSILRLDRITAKWDCVALHHPSGWGDLGSEHRGSLPFAMLIQSLASSVPGCGSNRSCAGDDAPKNEATKVAF